MKIHVHESDAMQNAAGLQAGGTLIDRANGAVNGFCMSISHYAKTEYGQPGVHNDQEGFYVLAGYGTAKVGDEEFEVQPGSAFLAAKGVPHTMKHHPASPPIKVLWCHGAV